MSSNSWNRSWTTQEIVDNASNWSLAGDAGLLKYLETFSEDLLSKAEDTNTNLNKLLDDLSNASLSLDVIKNEFSSLHNVQFVESRVYEEDETLPVDQIQENIQNTKISEDERTLDMKEAVLRGIEVIDKYYDKVQVPASDSEDETDFPSFVLRPKDPYFDRPLPYIIGSDEWYNKWHVGLVDSSSESDSDRVSEKFSDSDSESDLPVQNRSQFKGISNSGSEADLSNRQNINPVANSTFDESVKQPGIFASSDSEEYNSVPVQAPISNRSFAQELAAKLGNVIEQNTQVIEPEINKRPIQSAAPLPNRIIGNIFLDEPPPIDEDDIMFGKSNIQQGVFSGGGDLFDDLDNSRVLWNEKREQDKINSEVSVTKSKLPNLFDDDEDDIFNASNSAVGVENVSQNITSKKISEGLFDEDSSEDDLFNERTMKQSLSKPFLQPVKPPMPFFDDEPPELESKTGKEDVVKPKKPIGGVKVIENSDLFKHQKIGGLLKVRRQESSESSDKDEINTIKTINESPLKTSEKSKDLFSDFDKSTNKQTIEHNTAKKNETKENISSKSPPIQAATTEKNLKQLSLFDDDDIGDDGGGLFGDDLFSNISTKKFTSSLFEEKPLGSDLFANVDESNKLSKDDLFAEVNPIESNKSPINELFVEGNVNEGNKLSSDDLFAEVDDSKFKKLPNNDLFGDESSKPIDFKQQKKVSVEEKKGQLSKNDVINKEQTPEIKKASKQVEKDFGNFGKAAANLFRSDSDDEVDDLFTINKTATAPVAAPRNLKSENTTAKNTSKSSEGLKQDTEGQDNLFKGSVNINFFDQNPPDDDNDDWDTKSDTNLFEDNDATLFDNTPEVSSHRSGLFDNEPPSLFYESSGIVRDFSTRVETDDSFNPYASSSRRFSSDIFNEQQSSDSFFITKSKSHIDPQATLGNIQEISNFKDTGYSYSNVDITPSGNIDDLLPEGTVSAVSLQTQGDIGEIVKDDDNTQNKSIDEPEEPSLEDSSGSDLFAPTKKVVKFDTEKGEVEKTKVKPPITTKPSTALKKDEAGDNTSTATPKIGSPGKLKHNLNINVGALLPGVSPPKRKDLEKSSSFDVAPSYERNATDLSSKSLSPSSTASKSSEELTQDVSPKKLQTSSNLESSSSLPGILPSITKDRVRIPIKRRPSTRKARQESIRNSGIDFKINVESEQGTKSDEDIKTDEQLQASAPTENIFDKPKEIPKKDFAVKNNDPLFDNTIEPDSLFFEEYKQIPKKEIVKKSNKPSFHVSPETVGQKSKQLLEKEVIKKSNEPLVKPDLALFDDPLFAEDIVHKPKEISKKSNEQFDKPDSPLFDDPVEAAPLFGEKIDQKSKDYLKKEVVKKDNEQLKKPDLPLFDDPLETAPLFGENIDQKPKEISKKTNDKPDILLFDEPVEFDPLFSENIVQETKKVDKNKKRDIEEQPKASIFSEEKSSVINSDSFESADFKKSDLFDESEEFDDIFSSKKLPPKSNILKKSLFDDELDDDDIFGTTSHNERSALVKNASGSKVPQKKSAKITQIKKLENTEAVEDPLSSFND